MTDTTGDNGSKPLTKGILDGGAIPPCSTTEGQTSFDRVSNNLKATSEATDLISAKTVTANDSNYDLALAA